MARAEIEVAAPRETVWDLLADPGAYGEWVVGTQNVTRADGSWPAVGSALEYRIGIDPVSVGDRTSVVEARPPHSLELRAELQRLGAAAIRLELEPAGEGTRVVMYEEPVEGLAATLHTRLGDAALKARGDIALGRLKRLAEARA
jgi:uncharacterized protein YndB with AHSA1/START domain